MEQVRDPQIDSLGRWIFGIIVVTVGAFVVFTGIALA
jgi:hypothetical protein